MINKEEFAKTKDEMQPDGKVEGFGASHSQKVGNTDTFRN